MWRDDFLRTLFILMIAANFLFAGPVLVGIPVLADTKLTGGAAAYGVIMGAFGGGNFLGIMLSNVLLSNLSKRVGGFMVLVIATFGFGLGLLGIVSATPLAFIILLVMGTGNGILAITVVTLLQRKAPREMLGRIMSLVMLAGVGLQPISQALTGALIKVSFSGMYFGAGGLMLLVALWLAFQPVSRMIQHLNVDNLPAPGD